MYRSPFLKPELLAPAGNWEALEAVVESGADAVYLSGKRFAMRQHARWLNFDDAQLAEASRFLHDRGRRLYLTLNNLYSDAELSILPEYLESLSILQPDALIVADLGLVRLIRSMNLEIPLYASVMMQIHSAEGVRELQALGFQRVITSQSIPLEAVRRIREVTGIEIEHFIHGDTCTAVQGLCSHSGISCGELSGRGKCMKSCRWAWDFVSLNSEGDVRKIYQSTTHALARKDLCLYKQIPQLIHAGIHSFKIEGRSRPADYLRPIVRAYRELIDEYCEDPAGFRFDESLYREMHAHRLRDYSTSWTFGNPGGSAIGYDGKREPRIFSIAIEERDSADVETEELEEAIRQSCPGLPINDLSRPVLTVRCGSPLSVQAALENGAGAVIVGGEIATGRGQHWAFDTLVQMGALAHESGAQALLATPRLTNEAQLDQQRFLLENLPDGAFDAVLVHNIGMLRLVRATASLPVRADYSFNLFNAGTAAMLASLGATQATVSIEATLDQAIGIRQKSELPLELIVHGSLPGMVMEHCLIAAMLLDLSPDDPCPAPCHSGLFALRDQLGQIHTIETDQYCRNHLQMGKDMCALQHLRPVLWGQFASLRLEMPYNSAACVGLATQLYRKAIERFFSQCEVLVDDAEYSQLLQISPRPFALGALANRLRPVAMPDAELPTRLLIRYDTPAGEESSG